ncbi:hypothetical protein L195_g064446, partial [Trifolium pratense]
MAVPSWQYQSEVLGLEWRRVRTRALLEFKL